MIKLKEFRKANALTQDELGAYLGMKKSFISKIENGREKLPADKFQKLLNNTFGWNVSCLEEEAADDSGGSHGDIIGKLIDELSAQRRQNDKLITIIDRLTSH